MISVWNAAKRHRYLLVAAAIVVIFILYILGRNNGFIGHNDLQNYMEREQMLANAAKLVITNYHIRVNISGNNVISMSLWGSNPRYVIGVLRNSVLVKVHFPGWRLRVYVEKASKNPVNEPVPEVVLQRLVSRGAELIHVDPHTTHIPPMMWRFLVADDTSVDHFLIRDSDSRLSSRDSAAVSEWLKSGKPFHCIRDHPSHALYAVSGGLWGGKPGSLKQVEGWRTIHDIFAYSGAEYLADMILLQEHIWPLVEYFAYCSDSVSCDTWQSSHPFPILRTGLEHCGAVFDADDMMRVRDIAILIGKGENYACMPEAT